MSLIDSKNLCDHTESINLPCGHYYCKQCFFEKHRMNLGPIKCELCDFTTNELESYAKNGNYNAYYIMGYMHNHGINVKQNYTLAEEYYLKSIPIVGLLANPLVGRGLNLYIYADLGTLYYVDLNNNDKAYDFYSKMCKILEDNDDSKGLPLVDPKGISLVDNVDSYYSIYSYELQNLVKLLLQIHRHHEHSSERKRALKLLKRMVDVCPDTNVYWLLGKLYDQSGDGIDRNIMEAYKWYEKADCKYSMGCIQNEIKQYRIAVDLFKCVPVTSEYYSDACKMIGKIYENRNIIIDNTIIDNNYVEAKNWYEKSITGEDCTGYLNIADLYKTGGHGITKDVIEAGIYYKLFLRKNKNLGKKRTVHFSLARLYEKLSPDKINERIQGELYGSSPLEEEEKIITKKRKCQEISNEDECRSNKVGTLPKSNNNEITNDTIINMLLKERTKHKK